MQTLDSRVLLKYCFCRNELYVLSTYTCDGHLLLHAFGAPVELQKEGGSDRIGQVVEAIACVYHHVIQKLCKRNVSAQIKPCEAFVGRKSRLKNQCLSAASI